MGLALPKHVREALAELHKKDSGTSTIALQVALFEAIKTLEVLAKDSVLAENTLKHIKSLVANS